MAKQPWGGRPDKAALARMKLGTMVVSIAAFVGSLAGVAYLNPGIKIAANSAVQASTVTNIASTGRTATLSASTTLRRQGSAVPLVRSRAS